MQSIEILRGAETAGDASGQSVLLNVVRTPFTGQGFGSTGFEYAPQDDPMPNAVLAWTGRAHTVDYSVGASTYSFRARLAGLPRQTDAHGEASGRRRDISPRDYGQYAAQWRSGRGAQRRTSARDGQGVVLALPRGLGQSKTSMYEFTGSDFNPYTESKRGGEFGARFDRGIGQWDINSVLLLTRSRFESDITSTHRDAAAPGSVFAQQQLRDSGESVLRGTLARDARDSRHRIEVGVEGAINTLDARWRSRSILAADLSMPVRNANVSINEKRADAFFNHSLEFR